MKPWTVILALLCVAAAFPPMPKVYRPATGTTQGAGALALITRPKLVSVVPVLRTNFIAWKYPASINPSNYWWNVLDRRWTTNGWSAWSVAISNSTAGNDTVFVGTNRLVQWRLQGRTQQ